MGQFDCHILFRKYIWTRNEIDANSSQQLVHLGLHQTVTNIYNDHFPAAPELTAEIASLLFRETEGADIQANMGTNTHSLSPKAKEVAYKPYVPDHLWTQKSPAEWVHLIDGAAKNHKGQSIPDWTCDLVKRLQTSDLFGANFYLLVNPKFDKRKCFLCCCYSKNYLSSGPACASLAGDLERRPAFPADAHQGGPCLCRARRARELEPQRRRVHGQARWHGPAQPARRQRLHQPWHGDLLNHLGLCQARRRCRAQRLQGQSLMCKIYLQRLSGGSTTYEF